MLRNLSLYNIVNEVCKNINCNETNGTYNLMYIYLLNTKNTERFRNTVHNHGVK